MGGRGKGKAEAGAEAEQRLSLLHRDRTGTEIIISILPNEHEGNSQAL
jgi:hypothetical protein